MFEYIQRGLDAYFGKVYKTRDGRKAVCDGIIEGLPYFSIEGYTKNHGIIYMAGDKEITFLTPWLEEELKGCGDIVSEWQEEINEYELDKLANESSKELYTGFVHTEGIWICGFKAGYRKALKQ